MTTLTAEKQAAMTPEQARAACDAGMHSMGTTRWLMMRAIENLAPAHWMHQVAPGTNHIMFNVGHIAQSELGLLQMAGGSSRAVPASYKALFDQGCRPSADASGYPDPAEVVDVLQRVRTDLVAHLRALPGERLLEAPALDILVQVAPTLAHLPGFIALHEGTHAGQVLLIRRALGLPGVLG